MPKRKPLTPAEWPIMRAIWRHPETEVTVREICDELTERAQADGVDPPAYSTVKTVMERLVEKSHLATRKRGKVGFFRPLSRPEEASRSTIQSFVERMFNGTATPLVNYLTGGARLTDEDLERLETFLAQHRKHTTGNP